MGPFPGPLKTADYAVALSAVVALTLEGPAGREKSWKSSADNGTGDSLERNAGRNAGNKRVRSRPEGKRHARDCRIGRDP